VPEETTISDCRKNTQTPTVIRVNAPVSDIVAFMDKGGILPATSHNSFRLRTVTIILVNIAIMSAIAFLRYRQMKNKK